MAMNGTGVLLARRCHNAHSMKPGPETFAAHGCSGWP
jgi:hypothetical protein